MAVVVAHQETASQLYVWTRAHSLAGVLLSVICSGRSVWPEPPELTGKMMRKAERKAGKAASPGSLEHFCQSCMKLHHHQLQGPVLCGLCRVLFVDWALLSIR